ncbi:MAG: HalD/BesD family halogenase [Alphaproteobacteria bacterium]
MAYQLKDLVNLERYPIDDLDGAGATLLQSCQDSLADGAMCHLPDFVKPEALAVIQAEVNALRNRTYWMEVERRAYSWRDPDNYPRGHPVTRTTPNLLGTITQDCFPKRSAFVSIFEQPALTGFIRRCLGLDSLYPVACPYLAANVKVMGEGCRHAWHFDQNDGAVTLMIQSAAAGGHFEYVPYLRDEDDENYTEVGRLLSGEDIPTQRADLADGSFCLFKGRRSIHRVSEVTQGAPDRLLAVFSYHHIPGHRYKDSTVRSVLGRLPESYPNPA